MRNDDAIALNRFGLGATPGASVGANPLKALLVQLDKFEPRPPLIAAQPSRAELVASLSEVRAEKQQRKVAAESDMPSQADKTPLPARKAVREDYVSAVHARMQTALSSPTSFAERLVHFWSNHFAVSIDKIAILGLAGNFEFEAIRPHIFGRFTDLLSASTYHPAMLLYLDQAQSVGPNSQIAQRVGARGGRDIGLNENLAREILELHTLGHCSTYNQSDVTEFARAMTGLTVGGLGRARFQRLTGNAKPGEAVFVEAMHEPGKRTIVGQTYAQGAEKALTTILSDLSTHRATARHIATKLARHFVADLPPATLVAKLETSFLKSGGDLPALYRTLIEAPESWIPQQAKFKNPWEWTVSALRALGVTEMPGREQAAVALLNQMGQPVWKPGSPKGYGDVASDWASPAGLLRRVETAGRFARLAANRIDARNLAPDILGDALTKITAEHIARAESPEQGLALMLVAPEFLRR